MLLNTVGLDIPFHGAIKCALADWLLFWMAALAHVLMRKQLQK